MTAVERLRAGDVIKVELTVDQVASYGPGVYGVLAPEQLAELAEAGKVEVVKAYEPGWQSGDLARHVETGELYRYLPDDDSAADLLPWLSCNPDQTGNGSAWRWRSREQIGGTLRRLTLALDDPPPVDRAKAVAAR